MTALEIVGIVFGVLIVLLLVSIAVGRAMDND